MNIGIFDSFKYNKKINITLFFIKLLMTFKKIILKFYLKKEEKFKLNNYTLFDPIDKIKLSGNYNLIDSLFFTKLQL